MPTTSSPTWAGPHSGVLGDASAVAGSAEVNQLLGTHAAGLVFQGNVIAAPSNYRCGLGSPYKAPLLTLDFDQPFTMSGTSVGRVQVPVLPVGAGADLLVSLCQDSSGHPGSVVAQTRIPAAWIAQLAPVAGAATGTTTAPTVALTGNPLAVAQFSMIEQANFQQVTYPTPASTGVAAASSATWYYPYIVQIGGVNSGTALSTVFTIPYGTNGALGKSIPQPAFPVANDGSSASCVALDAQSNTPVVVNTGGGTSYLGAAVNTAYTSNLNTSTGALSAWSSQAALPVAVQSHVMCANGSWVYSIGGKNSTGTLANVYYAQVQNGQISAWNTATPLPVPTELALVCVTNGFLFVIGGTTSTLTPVFTSVWFAPINSDGSLGAWRAGPALPNADDNFNDNAYANEYGIVAGDTYASCLPVGPNGPGTQWFQGHGGTGFYPGFVDSGTGIVSVGSQFNGLQWTYDTYLFPYISVPLPSTGLTNGATYHVLLQQQGGNLNDYLLLPVTENVGISAQTSAPGAYSWTPWPSDPGGHLVGSALSVFDQTIPYQNALPWHSWEDNGARVTTVVCATTPDQRLLGLCEATRIQAARNANQGFETGIAPWTVTGGTVAQSTAHVAEGQYAAQITPNGTSATVTLTSEQTLPCQPGQQVTVNGQFWFTNAVTGANFSLSIAWFTQAGTPVSTTNVFTTMAAGAYTPVTNTLTAPAGAYQYAIQPTLQGTPSSGQVWYADQVYSTDLVTPQQSSVVEVTYPGAWPGVTWPPTGIVELA